MRLYCVMPGTLVVEAVESPCAPTQPVQNALYPERNRVFRIDMPVAWCGGQERKSLHSNSAALISNPFEFKLRIEPKTATAKLGAT